jgi:hypothetical protein
MLRDLSDFRFFGATQDSCLNIKGQHYVCVYALITFAENLTFDLPIAVADGLDYLPFIASNYHNGIPIGAKFNVTTDCGDWNYGVLTVETTNASCVINVSDFAPWEAQVVTAADVFTDVGFEVQNITMDLIFVERFLTRLASRYVYVLPGAISHVFYQLGYTGDEQLPRGIDFDEERGTFTGVPSELTTPGQYVMDVYVADEFSGLVQQVYIVSINIALSFDKPSTTFLEEKWPFVILIPVVATITLILLLVYCYRRHDRRKLFHIFISYRGRLSWCV